MVTSGAYGPDSETPVTCIIAEGIFTFAPGIEEEIGVPLFYFDTISPVGLSVLAEAYPSRGGSFERYGSNERYRIIEDKPMRQKGRLLLDEAASWSLLWYLYGKSESLFIICWEKKPRKTAGRAVCRGHFNFRARNVEASTKLHLASAAVSLHIRGVCFCSRIQRKSQRMANT